MAEPPRDPQIAGMQAVQHGLFADPRLPKGFAYGPEIMSAPEADELEHRLAGVNFRPFEFRGVLGRRRVAAFGWGYDFNRRGLTPGDPMPGFLEPVRERAAAFAGLAAADLEQVLINEYASGAGIGWHRDRPQFGDVIAVSLGGAGRLRFRRREDQAWLRAAITVEPRSAYLLRGEARTIWEHSLPEVEALRYSITFRTLRKDDRIPDQIAATQP